MYKTHLSSYRPSCSIRLFGALALLCAALVLPLSGCGGNGGGKLDPTSIPLDSIVSVNLVSTMGNITVEQGSAKVVEIIPTYTITATGRERRELIKNSILVTTDQSNPSLLTVLSRVGDGVVLTKEESVSIDLTIRVPDGVGSIIIQSGSGDILVDSMKDIALSIVNESGNVEIKDTTCTHKSNITNVIGDVNMNLKSIENAQEIRVATDMGNIKLNVPKRASYTVTVNELSQAGTTWSNKEGKTLIYLSTKVGSIRFQK